MRPRPNEGSMTFGVNSRTVYGCVKLAQPASQQGETRTGLFERLALDGHHVTSQRKFPAVWERNDRSPITRPRSKSLVRQSDGDG